MPASGRLPPWFLPVTASSLPGRLKLFATFCALARNSWRQPGQPKKGFSPDEEKTAKKVFYLFDEENVVIGKTYIQHIEGELTGVAGAPAVNGGATPLPRKPP